MRRMTALVFILALLGGAGAKCGAGDPNTPEQPHPFPGDPAPAADPRPSGSPKTTHYLRFQVTQLGLRMIAFGWRFGDVAPPPKDKYVVQYYEDLETQRGGVAKISVHNKEAHLGFLMKCEILYRTDANQEWRIVAEDEGNEICETIAVIAG